MKRVNYHTHTKYCRHAGGTVEEYVREAVGKKLEILGFSDHLPYPGNIYGNRMDYEELPLYCEDIRNLQEQYKGRIKLHCGFEGEYMRDYEKYYAWLHKKGFCQYLIMGQHWFQDDNGKEWQTGNLPSTEYYLLYVKSVLEGMRTGLFQMVAHPDLIFMNWHKWDRNCDAACDLLVEQCELNHYMLEFNANGYRRGIGEFEDGRRYQYPHRKLWEKVAQTGIPVVIGSDCHQVRQVYDEAVEKAYEEAEKLGLRVVTELELSI